MRLLVIGRGGQLARSLEERGPAYGVETLFLGRPEIDLAQELSIVPKVRGLAPDAIVNAAAYTAVDKAEAEKQTAYAINASGAGRVAEAAGALGIPIVHVSTDYVFDGKRSLPYTEDVNPAPVGAYGCSKLAGEQIVARYRNHVILRTSWVYSPFGHNFVRTMLRLAAEHEEISVVADQFGCPTSALDFADAVLRVCRNLVDNPSDAALRGTFHLAARGSTTWADFAEAVFRISQTLGGPSARVQRITTAEYPTAAHRPQNSRLDSSRVESVHGVRLMHWQQALEQCLERLISKKGKVL